MRCGLWMDNAVTVQALTERQVRRAFVNCSRGEADGLALPRDFAALDWAELDLLGWRDLHLRRPRLLVPGAHRHPAWLRERDPAEVVAERAEELRGRALAFLEAVRR